MFWLRLVSEPGICGLIDDFEYRSIICLHRGSWVLLIRYRIHGSYNNIERAVLVVAAILLNGIVVSVALPPLDVQLVYDIFALQPFNRVPIRIIGKLV